MKTILPICFLICICSFAIAQTQDSLCHVIPLTDGKVVYTDVVKLTDSTVSKNELYNRAKRWFVDNFKSAKDVIQLDDKDNGVIVGKGMLDLLYGTYCYFKVTIETKKSKYRYTFSDFEVLQPSGTERLALEQWQPSLNLSKKTYSKNLSLINSKMQSTISSLKQYLTNPPAGVKNDF